jgi:hypothetical protein
MLFCKGHLYKSFSFSFDFSIKTMFEDKRSGGHRKTLGVEKLRKWGNLAILAIWVKFTNIDLTNPKRD